MNFVNSLILAILIQIICPFTDGNAVYTARVILHAFEPDSNYYNYCEFAKNPGRESSERHSNTQQNQLSDNPFSDGKINLEYKLIPNPNNGTFSLLCPSGEQFTYSMYDSMGNKVVENIALLNSGVINISLKDISSGLYNLVITTASKRISLKFNVIRN